MTSTIVFKKIWDAINSGSYRYIILTGSSRSSKTHSILQIHHILAYTKSRRISIWRDTRKDTKDTILSDFKKIKHSLEGSKEMVFNKTESIYTYPNESTIEFCGTDDENKVHGFQSDIAHFNEPYKIPKTVFDQIDMRTSEYVIIDWNPRNKHWIDQLSKQHNAIVIHSTYKDNPFIPEQMKLKIQSYQPLSTFSGVELGIIKEHECDGYNTITNPLNFTKKQINELKRCVRNEIEQTADVYMHTVYALGKKSEKPNRIYKGWKTITKQQWEDLPYSEYSYLDFGSSNPTASGSIKFDGVDTFFIKERLHKPSSEMTGSISETLISIGYDKKIPLVCDSADPFGIQELMLNGFNAIPAMKGQGSVNSGIKLVQKFNIYYTTCSENVESEYDEYEWEIVNNTNLDRPLKKNDHQLDGIRYLITYLCFLLHIKK